MRFTLEFEIDGQSGSFSGTSASVLEQMMLEIRGRLPSSSKTKRFLRPFSESEEHQILREANACMSVSFALRQHYLH